MSTSAGAPSIETGAWTLDPSHSSVEFRCKTFWGLATVKGHFGKYEGRLDLSSTPAVELTIDAASLDTRNGSRDKHLRSDDFFDVENHPLVSFTAAEVTVHGDHVHASGTLAAAGKQIPLDPDVTLREVDGALELEATVTIQQSALGMTFTKGGMIRPNSWLTVKGRLIPAA